MSSKPRPLPMDRRFTYRFAMITRALAQQALLYVEREHGLNLAQYRILTVLGDPRAPSIKDIASHTQLDKAQVTRELSELTRRGFVIQTVDPQDRRLRVVELTRAGWSLVDATLPFTSERQHRLERRLSKTELRVVWKALAALAEEAERMLAEEVQKGRDRRRETSRSRSPPATPATRARQSKRGERHASP